MKLWGGPSTTLVVLALILSFSPSLLAQTSATGALSGTVTDPSGAVIPNVMVTATSESGQTRTAATGADGSYTISLLPPGNYRVKFEASGFKATEVPSASVAVTETAVLNRQLEVGAQSQEVTVQANVETVQTTSSTLGTVVGTQTVTALPLSTRNYTNLLSLSAGANSNVTNATAIGKAGQDIAVNGAAQGQNNYQMDGVSIVDYSSRDLVLEQGSFASLAIPNPDTLQEFKIQTSTYDASYGRNPGANVNVVTKSGTNDFHGTAFEFFRNTVLNANDFFLNAAGQPRGVLNQNQFGGVFGGPVKKDKLFFFVSYQETEQKNGIAPGASLVSGITLPPVPTGNRGTCPTGSATLTVCDAATQAFVANLGAAICPANHPVGANGNLFDSTSRGGTQVACNGSNINPVAVQLLQLKLPNGNYYLPSSGTANYQTTSITIPAIYHEHQGMGNVDYVINSKNTFSGRFFYATDPSVSYLAGVGSSGLWVPEPGVNTRFGNDAAVAKVTTLLSNNLVNEARISYQRNMDDATNSNAFTDTQVGMAPVNAGYPLMTQMTITPIYEFGTAYLIGPQHVATNQFQEADQISWTHGKHTIRAGFEYDHVLWRWNYPSLQIGGMTYDTFPDFLLGLPGCVTTGAACTASQAAGTTNGTAFSNISSIGGQTSRAPVQGILHIQLSRDANAFVQDDFKVNQRLTLNLGLRWEYDALLSDARGDATGLWSSLIKTQPIPGSGCVMNGITFGLGAAGSGCSLAGFVVPANYRPDLWGPIPAGVYQTNTNVPVENNPPWDNFAPRVGFAWQPLSTSRFVLRGGAGYFYDRVDGGQISGGINQEPPYVTGLSVSGTGNFAASEAQPFATTPLGWAGGTRWVNFANGTSSNLVLGSSGPWNQIFVTPLVYSYNLNIQYEFAPTWVLEVGYVGSHGIHQQDSFPVNGAPLASPSDPINGVTGNAISGATGPFVRVPYLGFGATLLQNFSNSSYKFNSLQATVRKQLSQGLTMQAAYTWSRAFFLTPAANPTTTPGVNPVVWEYELNPIYHPNRLTVNYNYLLPFGHPDGLKGKLVEGWNVSGVTTIQDGTPLTITDSRLGTIFGSPMSSVGGNPAGSPTASNAQFCSGMGVANVATAGSLYQRVVGGLVAGGTGYLNRTAFASTTNCAASLPTIGNGTGYGNSGLGILLGPGQSNWDISLSKVTRVGGLREDASLEFRTEFFNTFNHPQFNNPVVTFNSATFGQIAGSSVNPRLLQFALKYAF